MPGRGDQRAGRVLQYLAERNFAGHVVLEVNSRKSGTRAQREADLAESLAFARLHLAAPGPSLIRRGRSGDRQRALRFGPYAPAEPRSRNLKIDMDPRAVVSDLSVYVGLAGWWVKLRNSG